VIVSTPVLQRFYQSWLAQVNTAKVRFTHGAVASIPGGLVYGERSFVFFVRIEKRCAAACGSQRFMRSIKQCAAHAPASVFWVNEQQEHLALARMDGGETDGNAWFIDGDQQYVWRFVLNHKLVPLVRREHRLASELSEVCPPFSNGSIEHCTDVLSIAWNGASNRGHSA
jgi:hypothetical protein